MSWSVRVVMDCVCCHGLCAMCWHGLCVMTGVAHDGVWVMPCNVCDVIDCVRCHGVCVLSWIVCDVVAV